MPDQHVCYACGKVRSEGYHKQYPLESNKEPVPSLCTGCRYARKRAIEAGPAGTISPQQAQIAEWQWCATCGNLRSDEYHELYLAYGKNMPTWAEVCGLCMIKEKGRKKTAQLRSFLEGDIDGGGKGHRDTPLRRLRRKSRRYPLKPKPDSPDVKGKGKAISILPSADLPKKTNESIDGDIEEYQGKQHHDVSGIHESHAESSNAQDEGSKRPRVKASVRVVGVTCETESDEDSETRENEQHKARKVTSCANQDSQVNRAARRLGELRSHLSPPQRQKQSSRSFAAAAATGHDDDDHHHHHHQPESESETPPLPHQEGLNKPSSPKEVISGTDPATASEAELCYSAHASDAEVVDPLHDIPSVSGTFVWAPPPPSHSATTSPRRHSISGSSDDKYVPIYSHWSPIDGRRVWEVDSDEEREIERKRALFHLGLQCGRGFEKGMGSPSSG
jgi:hypothetical protein